MNEEYKEVLSFVKEVLGDRVKEVRISCILKSHAVCLSAEGPVSFEMEKYFQRLEDAVPIKAERILELNPDSGAFQALVAAIKDDQETARKCVEILYNQAILIAGLPLEDPAGYAKLVNSLMS